MLTEKQAAFVRAILAGKSGKAAAIEAGYSPKVAEVTASKMLRSGKVAEAVAAGRAQAAAAHGVTLDRVIGELAKIGFADIRKLVAWLTRTHAIEHDPETDEAKLRHSLEVALTDSQQLDPATAAAIAEIIQGKDGNLRVKLHPKIPALTALAQILRPAPPARTGAGTARNGGPQPPVPEPAEAEGAGGWGDLIPGGPTH